MADNINKFNDDVLTDVEVIDIIDEGFVPYTGATQNLNLGSFDIIADGGSIGLISISGNVMTSPFGGITVNQDLYALQDLQVTGLTTLSNLDVDTLNLNGNVISDSTGTISFSNENLTTTGNISSNKVNITNTTGSNGQGLEWNQTISTTASQIDFLRWAGNISKSSTGVLIARGLAFEPSINMTNVSSMAGATFVNASTYTAPSTSILPSLQVYYDSGTFTSTGGASTSGLYRSFESNPTFSSSSGGSYTITELTNFRAGGSSFSSGNTITTSNAFNYNPTYLFQTGTTWTGINSNPSLFSNTITNYRHIAFNDVTNATNIYGVYSLMNSASNKYFLYGSGTAESYLNGNIQLPDNRKIRLGTAQDSEIYYDGTDLIIDSNTVGSGTINFLGQTASTITTETLSHFVTFKLGGTSYKFAIVS